MYYWIYNKFKKCYGLIFDIMEKDICFENKYYKSIKVIIVTASPLQETTLVKNCIKYYAPNKSGNITKIIHFPIFYQEQ